MAEFQMICDGCDGLAIKIENPISASRKATVYCGGCGAPRGTLGALRDLAVLTEQKTPKSKYKSELVSKHQELQGLRRRVQLAELQRVKLASGRARVYCSVVGFSPSREKSDSR
jgi:hypothetical protein